MSATIGTVVQENQVESNSDSSPNRLQKFLDRYTVHKGCAFTHTSLGKPGGSYYIPVEYVNEFFKLYRESLNDGNDLYLTEKNRHIGPLKIDLDFRWTMDNNIDTTSHPYTDTQLMDILKVYTQLVRTHFHVEDDEEMTAYVMEKTKPSMTNNGLLKDGVHIMFPNIVSKASVQYIIRQEALKLLSETFKRMGCSNPPDDILDEAIIERNNWLMYGSKKYSGEPYVVTRIYRDGMNKFECIDDEMERRDEFVELLSIRNKYDESKIKIDKASIIQEFEEQQEKRRRKMETARNIISGKTNQKQNQCTDTDLVCVKKLTDILNPARAESYNDWIRLGWCLRNIDFRLVDAWEEFSRKSDKYVEGECQKIWNHMREGGLGMGTLHMWAKQDNPEMYKEIVRNDLRDLIFASRTGTHTDVARVIHHMYKHDYVCTSIKYKTWFEFRGHRWHESDGAFSLRMKISNEVWLEYMSAMKDWTQKAMDCIGHPDANTFQDNAKKMMDIAMKLKTISYKDNVMKECSELFYKEKFEDLLDSYENLIGFENGVFDLDTFEFREGRPEDYVSFTTGNDYIVYDPTNEYINAIKKYLSQVFTKPQVREYVMKLFAMILHGAVKEQKFYIWTGSGSNSKSLLVELFEKCFGEYCCKFPITLLTQKRAASNAATSELARAKGKRFACLQEPSEDEKLNIGLMKELSGGDKILARAIYKEPVEFKPQFKMLLLCNHLPHVPSDDGGTWRRIRVVEFTSKFVDCPQEENEFPIDVDLPRKMEAWRPHFMAMLLEYYKLYKQEGIQEPEEVLSCTREYKRNNDHLADFIHNCIERKDSAFLSLNDAFTELKSWAKDDNIPIKIPTKAELEKYLSKNLTKCVANNHFKGFKGYRLKNRFQTIMEDDGDGIDD